MTVTLSGLASGDGTEIAVLAGDGTQAAGISARLERAFGAVREEWEAVARALPADEINDRGHFGTCSPNVCDFGLMLAWSRLTGELASEPTPYRILCSDPWLFRHLARIDGVSAGAPPRLATRRLTLALRGLAARARTALFAARASLAMRRQPVPDSGAWLLVYGHPASDAEGRDGYFGDLMRRVPALSRALHVDCPPHRARELARDRRTLSLHGFGSPLFALTLAFRTWRVPARHYRGPYGWLVRRAVERDAGFAGAAMIAWQIHCQRRWIRRCRPASVLWPWENHGWERSFCRELRRAGCRSAGYQHSVVGQQWNLGPRSNPDGAESLPDRILCNGPAGRRQLEGAGYLPASLETAGALRFPAPAPVAWSADGPVFVAVPFDLETGRQMVEACRRVAGRRFLVRTHPMTPLPFESGGNIARADGPLSAQSGIAAVLYAATTVGLEAWMAGLPTIRFRPDGRLTVDIMPSGTDVPAAEATSLADVIDAAIASGPSAPRTGVFSAVDMSVWERYVTAPGRTGPAQPDRT